MKTILIILTVLLSIYFFIGLILYLKQRSLLYFPTPPIEHPFTTMTIENENERINIIITNPGREKALLYFGGNAETVAAGAEVFARELPEYTTYMVEYRGYGLSSGTPTEAGIFSDALAIYDHIKPNHTSISLFGRSLGTGVACFIASHRETDKLVLITPYDSIEHIARDRFPLFPMSILVKDRYDSLGTVADIKARTIILIAEHDTTVPKKYAYSLVDRFPKEQIEVHEIKNAHHNDIADTKEYREILEKFFYER